MDADDDEKDDIDDQGTSKKTVRFKDLIAGDSSDDDSE